MARRATIHKIKAHRVYTIDDAALCVGVTPQTMRRWAGEGLRVMSQRRPHLILGDDLRAFVKAKRASVQGALPLGSFRCLRCKGIGPPALSMLDYAPLSDRHGMLSGFCGTCEGAVTRIVSGRDLPAWAAIVKIGNSNLTRA